MPCAEQYAQKRRVAVNLVCGGSSSRALYFRKRTEHRWGIGRRRLCCVIFFFSSRRRHTRCSRDWSSDVCSSDLITVGAMKTMGTPTRNDDLITSYSSKGPTLFDHVVKPDIVAPGNRTVSVLDAKGSLQFAYPANDVPASYYQKNPSNSGSPYYILSGTSMAAAVVSGGVAVLLHTQPNLTPDQVKARLMKTASKSFPAYSTATDPITGATYASQYDIFTVGAGYLDVAAALADSDVATGNALSPTAAYDSSNGNEIGRA